MLFGDTEIKASAMDIGSNQTVRAYVDFLNESNPKYTTKMQTVIITDLKRMEKYQIATIYVPLQNYRYMIISYTMIS